MKNIWPFLVCSHWKRTKAIKIYFFASRSETDLALLRSKLVNPHPPTQHHEWLQQLTLSLNKFGSENVHKKAEKQRANIWLAVIATAIPCCVLTTGQFGGRWFLQHLLPGPGKKLPPKNPFWLLRNKDIYLRQCLLRPGKKWPAGVRLYLAYKNFQRILPNNYTITYRLIQF